MTKYLVHGRGSQFWLRCAGSLLQNPQSLYCQGAPPKLTIFWIIRSTPKPTELSHSVPWGWSLQVCIPKGCSWPCCHCCLGAHSLGTAALTQASGSIPKAFVYVSTFSLLIFELLWSKPPCVPWQGFTEEMHWKKCEFSRRSKEKKKKQKNMGIFQKRYSALSPFTWLEAWFTQKYVWLCWEATTVTPVLGALECPWGCLLVTSSSSFSFLFRDSLPLHGRKMFFLVYGMQIASSRSLFPSDCLWMNFAVFTEGGTLSHCSPGEPPLWSHSWLD